MPGKLQKLVVGAIAVTVLGCSDSALSPNRAADRSLAPHGVPTLDVDPALSFSGLKTTTITLTSAGGTYSIGNGLFEVKIPSNSVCDPALSTYGDGTWDSPCTLLASGHSLSVTVTYGFTSANIPVFDVSPGVRFTPNAVVTLGTMVYASAIVANLDYFTANPQALHYFGMYYTTDLGATAHTDAGKDNSLITHVNLSNGYVWRRVKHFSGYNVLSGLPCDPSPDDPNCIDDGGPDVQH